MLSALTLRSDETEQTLDLEEECQHEQPWHFRLQCKCAQTWQKNKLQKKKKKKSNKNKSQIKRGRNKTFSVSSSRQNGVVRAKAMKSSVILVKRNHTSALSIFHNQIKSKVLNKELALPNRNP